MGILKFIDNLGDSLYNKFSHNKINGPIFLNENDEDNRLDQLKDLLNKVGDDQKDLVEKEIRLIEAGRSGENNVIYELKRSKENIIVLHDITLEDSFKDSQIDFLIISQSAIIVLETKKLTGDVEVNSDGDFIRHYKNADGKVYKKEGIYSPITQNEYHINAVKDLLLANKLIKKLPFYSLVVIANPKTIINKTYAKKEIKDKIIKYDQLNRKVEEIIKESMKLDFNIPDNRMISIAELLISSNEPREYDYVKKLHLKLTNEVKKDIDIVDDDKKIIDDKLYEKLREYRYKKAKELNYKPYFIFNNNQLGELVLKKPKTKEEFIAITGFGETKFEQYGQEIIEIIKQDESNDSSNDDIISALKAYRIKQCNIEKVKPYMIFNNAEMEDLIDKNPKTKEELLKVKGFGQTKVDKYGDEILKILNNK